MSTSSLQSYQSLHFSPMPLGLARSLRRRWWWGALLVNGEFASLHPSPPNSDLARRRWQRGALLDQNSAFLHLSAPIFTCSFARPGSVRGTRAGRLLLLPCWTRSTPSFAPSGGLHRAEGGAAAAAALLDEVYAFPRAVRRCARSWSWTAAATTLLTRSFAPPGGICGAGAGRQLLLPFLTS